MNSLQNKLSNIDYVRGDRLVKSADLKGSLLKLLVNPKTYQIGGGGTAGVVTGAAVDNTYRKRRLERAVQNYTDHINAQQPAVDQIRAAIARNQEYLKDDNNFKSLGGFGPVNEQLKKSLADKIEYSISDADSRQLAINQIKQKLQSAKTELANQDRFFGVGQSNLGYVQPVLDFVGGAQMGRALNKRVFDKPGQLATATGTKLVTSVAPRAVDFISDTKGGQQVQKAVEALDPETAQKVTQGMNQATGSIQNLTGTLKGMQPYTFGGLGGLTGGVLGSVLADATNSTSVDSNLSDEEKEKARREANRRKAMFALGGGALGGLAGYIGGGGSIPGFKNKTVV